MSIINRHSRTNLSRTNLARENPVRSQSGLGYTLIEVVIGILIFSIGILGMATMQISAKRLSYDALQRSIATTLINDIVERMRSNRWALERYAVVNLGNGSLTTEPADCIAATCTDADLADRDLWEWEQAMDGVSEQTAGGTAAGGLISPRGCINVAADKSFITVTITWKGFQSLGNPSPLNTCGTGLGLYGTAETERQIIFISTVVDNHNDPTP